jgi:dTDP-4-amino-4,6-dideoxygalactose transaminase
LFTTFEGGAIISKDESLKKRIDYLKNFGIADEVTVIAPGINGKMNEFQSVIGLLSLEIVDNEIKNRKKVAQTYFNLLSDVEGIKFIDKFNGYDYNYAYFPILIDHKNFGASCEYAYTELRKNNVYARRYFYPLISNLPSYRDIPSAYKDNLPIANKIAEQVLCLPIYGSLHEETIVKIGKILKSFQIN